MLIPGLVSVTFRELPPEQIIALAAEAGLRSIEWGGDIHVPHGNLETARRVGHLMRNAGLEISAYGSYYRAAGSPATGLNFGSVCNTAVALGAPIVRVWAGGLGSAQADAATRRAVIGDLQIACDTAAAEGIDVSLEFHGETLADAPQAATQLVNEIARPNLSTYWQPPNGVDAEVCTVGLQSMLPHVRNVHVFHWWPDHHHRLPLESGADRWRAYFRILSRDPARRHVSLEFVRNGEIAQFRKDANTLHELLFQKNTGREFP
jgi:sugar phosphate isomerase/epimerase